MRPSIFCLFLLPLFSLPAQSIKVSDQLNLIPLSAKVYVHTCDNNNGLVLINEGKALIVSTPDSDSETQKLIDWVSKEQGGEIVAYIIDRWHPDAMEGLDVVHKNGIKSYGNERTRNMARQKGLPVPQEGFESKTAIQIGSMTVLCHYLGAAHTTDGIVVYVPDEEILFAGNGIRNYKGWVGNIADAHLCQWAATVQRIKSEYGAAKIVVPGHGAHGGTELLDYTLALYTFDSVKEAKKTNALLDMLPFANNEDFIIHAEKDLVQYGKRFLSHATVLVHDSTKLACVESNAISIQTEIKRLDSESGRVTIYDLTHDSLKWRNSVRYKKLILFKVDDEVGLRIILKEIEQ